MRDLDGFMLNVERLLASELLAIATPEEGWAALMLWCRAWKQYPAASLPNDDRVLASFSRAGKRWGKVRENALHGFILCSDDRLYHPVLCEEATRAYAKKIAYQGRRETDRKRLAEWRLNNPRNARETPRETVDGTPDETRVVAEGTGTGTGTGTVVRKKEDAAEGGTKADPAGDVFNAAIRLMTNRGIPERQARSLTGKWRKDLKGDDGRLLAIVLSVERQNPIDPVGYLTKAIQKATNGGLLPNEGVFV